MGVLAGDAGDAFLLVKTVVAFAMPLYLVAGKTSGRINHDSAFGPMLIRRCRLHYSFSWQNKRSKDVRMP